VHWGGTANVTQQILLIKHWRLGRVCGEWCGTRPWWLEIRVTALKRFESTNQKKAEFENFCLTQRGLQPTFSELVLSRKQAQNFIKLFDKNINMCLKANFATVRQTSSAIFVKPICLFIDWLIDWLQKRFTLYWIYFNFRAFELKTEASGTPFYFNTVDMRFSRKSTSVNNETIKVGWQTVLKFLKLVLS